MLVHQTESAPPVLVRYYAGRQAQGRAETVHAAGREDRAVPRRRRRAGRAGRTAAATAPPSCPKAGARTAISCAAITAGNTTAPASWCGFRSSRLEQPHSRRAAKAFHAPRATAMSGSRSSEPLLRHSRFAARTAIPPYRRIHQFDDRWNTAALRMMENSFDNAHFSFVHKSHLRPA